MLDIEKINVEIRSILLQMGQMALEMQKNVKMQYKSGEQALTEADLACSRLVSMHLENWTQEGQHLLIDEENIIYTPKQAFAKSDYLWVVDPIDGTAGYAVGRRLWGVSLALLYKGVPLAGGIYLPAMKELFFTEGERSFLLNLEDQSKTELRVQKLEVNSQTFIETYFANGRSWGCEWHDNPLGINTPESAVEGFASVLRNQAAGATLIKGFSFWDVAGIFALIKNTGHKILSMEDGQELVAFTAEDFTDQWKLKQDWLLCHPDNFDLIRKGLTG